MWIRKQEDDGSEHFIASGNNSEFAERITKWNDPAQTISIEAAMGRGVQTANTLRTYIRLTRTDGTYVYISVDTGTTVVGSTTQP